MAYIVKTFVDSFELAEYYDCFGLDCEFDVVLIDGTYYKFDRNTGNLGDELTETEVSNDTQTNIKTVAET